MNRGYIKIWRKIEDSGIIGNADVCQLFLFLMVKATHKPHKIIVGTQVIILQPGQFFAGRKQLALELRSSEQRIRTALKCLEKYDVINQQATSKGTIITLVNWGKYQDEAAGSNQHSNQGKNAPSQNSQKNSENGGFCNQQPTNIQQAEKQDVSTPTEDEQPAPNQHINQPPTSGQPAPNQHLTTKQTHNTETHEELKTPPIAPQGGQDDDVPAAFAQFWRAYPKKIGKRAALKAWKGTKSKPDIAVLLAAIAKQKTWPQWQRDGGQYIPNPSTWLNQGRWSDEPPETQSRASPPGRAGFGKYGGGNQDYGQSDFGALGGDGT